MSKAARLGWSRVRSWLADYAGPTLVATGLLLGLGLVLAGMALLTLIVRLGALAWRWRGPIAAGLVVGAALRG